MDCVTLEILPLFVCCVNNETYPGASTIDNLIHGRTANEMKLYPLRQPIISLYIRTCSGIELAADSGSVCSR